jgi:FlaA1/EpsC-like NDP-sugar epimerase
MHKIFDRYKPDFVFHAAAYKHVPLMEENISEGLMNNIDSTLVCAELSIKFNVSNFILISSDKAVRPTNVMGASKRISEIIIQALADSIKNISNSTKFSIVRFGNVLGSSGSVVESFSSQIKMGGPVTLTHPEVTRYFMTIPEAAELVIQSSYMTTGGEVFVLDMGAPIRIYDLAVKMIYLSGHLVKDDLNPSGDIEIQITGLRPGEKLYEELLIGSNPIPTDHPRIIKAHEDFIPKDELMLLLTKLKACLDTDNQSEIKKNVQKIVPGYSYK